MPQTATQADREFLDALDAWIARGRNAYEFAAAREISPQTVTYRQRLFGLRAKRAEGLVDLRTGESYRSLVDRGEIVFAEAPAAEPEAIPA